MAAGDDWTTEENDRLVEMYFGLLQRDVERIARGEPARVLQKASLFRTFGGRSKGSVEWKMMNVSAILESWNYPWISGLPPAENIQQSLTDAVARFLKVRPDPISIVEPQERRIILTSVEAPRPGRVNLRTPDHVLELIRRFDPAARDEANRKLGKAGEQLVFQSEFNRLNQVLPKRAADIKWVSQDEGDGHGYDIRSFDTKGDEMFIEVKTTRGAVTTPFFLSRNERRVAEERNDAYRIFRVFEYDRGPKFFTLRPPLDQAVNIEPYVYQASFT